MSKSNLEELGVKKGRAFIFLLPSTKALKVAIGDQPEQKITLPEIISRFVEVKIGTESIPALKLHSLPITAAVMGKQVYLPSESKWLTVLMPQFPGQAVVIRISCNDQPQPEIRDSLDQYGCLHRPLELTDLGQYQLQVKLEEGEASSQCQFSITEHSLALLTAVMKQHNLDGQIFQTKEISLMLLQQPYTGQVKVELRCGYCHNEVVAEQTVSFSAGKLVELLQFDFQGHTGPFTLDFTTSEGQTASILIEQSRREERETIELTHNLGRQFQACLMPLGSELPVREVYTQASGSQTADFVLETVKGQEAVVTATSYCPLLQMTMINALTGQIAFSRQCHGVAAGEQLSIPNVAPFGLLTVGAYFSSEKCSEGWAVVLCPATLQLQVEAPSMAQPGEEITLTLQTNQPCDALVKVMDARLMSHTPARELAQPLFANMKRALTGIPDIPEDWQDLPRVRSLSGRTRRSPALGLLGSTQNLLGESSRGIDYLLAEESTGFQSDINFLAAEIEEVVVEGLLPDICYLDAVAPADQEPLSPVAKIPFLAGRLNFPQLIYCQFLHLPAGQTIIPVKLGEQNTFWKITVFVLAEGWEQAGWQGQLEAFKANFVEADLPSLLAEGSAVEGQISYSVSQPARVKIFSPDSTTSIPVTSGQGQLPLNLVRPGEITIQLISQNGEVLDGFNKVILPPATQTVSTAQVTVLNPGQMITAGMGETLLVYPHWGALLEQSVQALNQYPHGCGEQTSAKLAGLAVLRQAINQGIVSANGRRKQVEERILAGLGRMRLFFHGENGFSLWENGSPTPEITRQVVKNLLPLAGDSTEVKTMLQQAKTGLLRHKVLDNNLLALDQQFLQPEITTIEDAAGLYLAGIDARKAEALQFILNTAQGNGQVYWSETKTWGGKLEATCLAAQVLYRAQLMGLFARAFEYIASQLVAGGRLFSTADTKQLVELLALMSQAVLDRKITSINIALINGSEQKLTGVFQAQQVQAGVAPVIVQILSKKQVNYQQLRANFLGEVAVEKTALSLGGKTTVTIRPMEETHCPMALVYLPANLTTLRGSGGTRTEVLDEPIKGRELTLDLVAIRPGKASLYVVLHDMYDPDKIGIPPAMEFTVV